MIRLPIGAKRASENTVKLLVNIGALYIDEAGIHAGQEGLYLIQEEIPTQTANQSGDK